MSILSDRMMSSARSGHSLGVVLDSAINAPAHDIIVPEACAEFKAQSEQWIVDNDLEQDEARAFRKACNNTINEVSRQYRKAHGMSIKCTGRKGGYKYEVCEHTPRPTTTGMSAPVSSAGIPSNMSYEDAVQQHPLSIMEAFVKVYDLNDIKGFLKHAIDVVDNP